MKLTITKHANVQSKLEGLFVDTDNLKRLVNTYELKVNQTEFKQIQDMNRVDDEIRKINENIKYLKSFTSDKIKDEEKLKEILESFKDRTIERFKLVAEDFSTKLT